MFKYIIISLFLLLLTGCQKDLQVFSPPDDLANDIYVKINHYRVTQNLNVIEENCFLDSIASEHAQYMASNNALSHYNESVRIQLAMQNLNTTAYAELIASGILTGSDLVSYWDGNDADRAIVVGDYSQIGLGVSYAGDCSYIAVVFVK